ncbi:DUF2723 domain-containing protein [Rubrolithibacter danxiaensis]|uniref:glycosyltransferase family 117 protein n=1 Tax=Rubrolithibacter danxiaensis TaxID=3390805 RepID=UPI003BF8A7FD
MKSFASLNNLVGVLCFLAAFVIYTATLQPTVSFWDCGEFIATAYKIQVGHQPGAPLFMMLAKIFSMIAAEPTQVAFWVNISSALASAATIMFLFWTITALALKLIKKETELNSHDVFTIIAAGAVGAMAFAVSDSFWFSAVEAEVYALSSLCTAVVFWAILKWESSPQESNADKWLVLISYIIGLSIGIHLLSLLAGPAIVLIYYFRQNKQASAKGIFLAFLAGCAILAFIQYGIVQYLVLFASKLELFFVNSLHFAFGTGALVFVILLISTITFGIIYSNKKQKAALNLGLVCLTFILLGYSSYAMILIRANAKTTINISNPDNAFSLLGYLGREQYGDRPLLYGKYFDSEYIGSKKDGNLYRKGENKYEVKGEKLVPQYDRNSVFPRIYSDDDNHIAFYQNWLGLSANEKASFYNNLQFFSSYQLGFMYWRYFMWNFSGRQNDEQGFGNDRNGSWITGIKAIDNLYSGNQEQLPVSITKNAGHNKFYALPFILGLIGLVYQFKRNRKDGLVVSLLFFFTGIAIVLYLNQNPIQVRERDYAYVGSFYTFAIWIGLGVLGIRDIVRRFSPAAFSSSFAFLVCFAAAPFIMIYQGWDDHNRSGNYVAHDMAVNYLQSCAPNAILFTNADNDTYPLWYAQEVEGVRPDVRIVNLQLLFNPSYIDKLKEKLYTSAPLPVTMPANKYVDGVRDVMPYVDYGLTDSVELSKILEVLTSDNEQDMVTMQDGSKSNFLPTKKFHLTVNPEQVLKTGTVTKAQLSQLSSKIEWSYGKNIVTRADLAMMDIIAHNNWKRPVYFTVSLSKDSYFGLDRYLYLEGYAYRLLPLKRDVKDERDKSELTNTTALYANVMQKFKLDSFNKAANLDPESRRVAKITWNTMNTLTENLIFEGKTTLAREVIEKALSDLPLRNYSIADTIDKYRATVSLNQLGETSWTYSLAKSAVDFLASEVRYLASLSEEEQQNNKFTIQQSIAIMEAFKKEAKDHNQNDIVNAVSDTYSSVQGKLIFQFQEG